MSSLVEHSGAVKRGRGHGSVAHLIGWHGGLSRLFGDFSQ
jgi:hypothetical protein